MKEQDSKKEDTKQNIQDYKTIPLSQTDLIDPEIEQKLAELRDLKEDQTEDPFEVKSYIENVPPITGFFNTNSKKPKQLVSSKSDTPKEKQLRTNKSYKTVPKEEPRAQEDLLQDLIFKNSNEIFGKHNRSFFENFLDFLDDKDPKTGFNISHSKYFKRPSSEGPRPRPKLEYGNSEIYITIDLSEIFETYKVNKSLTPRFFGSLKKSSFNQITLELTMELDGLELIQYINFQDLRKVKSPFLGQEYYMGYKYDHNTKTIKLRLSLNKKDFKF